MLPKYHILYGAIFSFLIWAIFQISIEYAFLIFLASFLIDVDHYAVYVIRKGNWSLSKANKYFLEMHGVIKGYDKKGEKAKAPLVVLHTVEFLIFMAILSFFSQILFFIFIGFIFHSFLDIIEIQREFKKINPRIFSLLLYFINKNKKDIKYL